ncbi:zinc finger, CCHC-type containing protein, partial [Tanacetum coccineum]
MAADAIKHMASNFTKLDKFEGVDFRRWQKKIHFLLSSMSVVYVLTTLIPEDGGDNPTMEQDSLEAKYMAEDASSKKFLVINFINYKMTDSRPVMDQYNKLLDLKDTLKRLKEESTLVELGSYLRIEESQRVHDNDKPKIHNVVGPLVVNMVEHNNSSKYNDNKGKRKHHDNTRADPNKKVKPTCTKGSVDGSSKSLKGQNIFNKSLQWIDSGAIFHVCKDRCWFKTYESLNDGSILHMGNESTTLVHGCGCVDLSFSSRKIDSLFNVLHVSNIRKNLVLSTFMSTSKLNDSILWHARLGHVHFKRMQDMSKDGLIPASNMDTKKFCYVYLLHIKDEALDNFKVFKTEVELQQGSLIKRFGTDRG